MKWRKYMFIKYDKLFWELYSCLFKFVCIYLENEICYAFNQNNYFSMVCYIL